jgi:MFS family permease
MGMRRGRSYVFWISACLIAVDVLLFGIVVPALPDLTARDRIGDAMAALIFAAFPLGQLVAALAAAGLVERWGRRPMMVAAAAVLTGATLMFAVTEGAALLAVARGAQGVAAGVTWTAALAAISDVYPNDELGFRIGLAETGGGAIGLLGPLLGGMLVDAVGTDATFALAALLPAALVPAAALVPETRRPGAAARVPVREAVARMARRPAARAGAVALGAAAAALALVEPLLPLDLADRLGLSATAVGAVFAIALFANLAMAPIAGRWSDRRGRRLPILVGGTVLAGSMPFLALGPVAVVALALLAFGAGLATLAAPSGPLLSEAVDRAGMEGNYGVSAGILTAIFAVGYAVGPLLGAAVSARLPFLAALVAGAFVVAVAALWAYRALAPGPIAPRPNDRPVDGHLTVSVDGRLADRSTAS